MSSIRFDQPVTWMLPPRGLTGIATLKGVLKASPRLSLASLKDHSYQPIASRLRFGKLLSDRSVGYRSADLKEGVRVALLF